MNISPLRKISSFWDWIRRIPIPGGVRLWITLLSLVFVFSSIISNSHQLAELSLDRDSFAWIILGLLLSLLSLIVNSIAWKELIKWLGNSREELNLISLFLRTNILKYMPGGIWHFVERLRVLRPYIGIGNAINSVLLEPIVMVVAALLLIPFGGFYGGLSFLCLLPPFLLTKELRQLILSRIGRIKFNQLIKADSSLLDSNERIQHSRIGRGYPWKTLFLEVVFLLFKFLGFWCCLAAFSIGFELPVLRWLSAFAFSWTVGLVVPAAPGGLGVFEAMLLLSIGNFLFEVPLIGAVLSYRVVSTLSDLLLAIPFAKFISRKDTYR